MAIFLSSVNAGSIITGLRFEPADRESEPARHSVR
jgi:hypothetical protein